MNQRSASTLSMPSDGSRMNPPWDLPRPPTVIVVPTGDGEYVRGSSSWAAIGVARKAAPRRTVRRLVIGSLQSSGDGERVVGGPHDAQRALVEAARLDVLVHDVGGHHTGVEIDVHPGAAGAAPARHAPPVDAGAEHAREHRRADGVAQAPPDGIAHDEIVAF